MNGPFFPDPQPFHSRVALSLNTNATFAQPGNYVIRFQANDGELTAYDSITINVSETSGGGPTGDRPGPSNTGPTNRSILTPLSNYNQNASNVVYSDFTWTGGQLTVKGQNVTFRNCIVDGGYRSGPRAGQTIYAVKINPGASATFEDCEILGAGSTLIYAADGTFTGRRLYLHDSGADLLKYNGGSNTSFTLEDSWGRFAGFVPGAHADFLQVRRGDNVTLRGNNCDFPTPWINGISAASANFPSVFPGAPISAGTSAIRTNACAIIEAADGDINNVVIEDNWLNGGNFTIYAGAEWCVNGVPQNGTYGCNGTFRNYLTNVSIQNNRIGDDYNFGLISTSTGLPVTTGGNQWDDFVTLPRAHARATDFWGSLVDLPRLKLAYGVKS